MNEITRPFGLGILLGRFQPLHIGHMEMINAALKVSERVGVMIGSSDEALTSKNPFSYEERRHMIESVFGDRVDVCPVPDIGVGNTFLWGNYVVETSIVRFGGKPDIFITGCEDRRTSWFEPSLAIYELCVPKSVDVSASLVRRLLTEDKKEEWMKYTDPSLYGLYGFMRERILETAANTDTSSL